VDDRVLHLKQRLFYPLDVFLCPALGGEQAVQLKVAERAVDAYGRLASEAKTTLVVPSNMTEVASLITSAMQMIQTGNRGERPPSSR